MKKSYLYIVAIAVVGIFSMRAHSAMLLGAKVGVDTWYSDSTINDIRTNDANNQFSYYVALEHFIPLIPNVKVRHSSMQSMKFNTDFNQMDFIAYYEILDNNLISFDVGLNLQSFNGRFNGQKFNEWQPNIYSEVRLGIPATSISLFGSLSFGSYDKTTTVDGEVGTMFTLGVAAADLNFKTGYRIQDYDFNYFGTNKGKFMNDGFFCGIEFNF
ncbi:TIGR04219 family outer membrane beta-barrel protein [Candidatus Enterovibrio escicola]|uniref:ABC-type Fe3+-hydroxamate transport system, periplasmic component n=1 Tax=Candidatus Enterovibrio escicola TaxID=1927127 RepID=A0A2A5T3F8_9GAMM|nr:TIGR04219 family outer membrane beta-barrel protein [Candidatus Enterovibrio escacola]PCS22699.1 hypothetical protein BTN49_1657 [Candidatus Enterovibrio escacola]